jgi:plasmid stabilization system protein ParE
VSSSLSVVVTKRARSQIERADAWWRENREASPDALVEELSRVFDLLSATPMIGQSASLGTRRVLLKRVHYFLYYRYRPNAKRVEIAALWHTRRMKQPY